MTAAAMLSIAMLAAMMIAGHRRVIAELSCQQSSHSLITAALDPAVQFDARIGQCLLGTAADAAALEEGIASGATFLASVHCDAPESLTRKPQLARLLATGAFGAAVFLTGRSRPGTGAQWVEL